MNWSSLKKLSTFSKNQSPIYNNDNLNLNLNNDKFTNNLDFYIQNILKLEKEFKTILKDAEKLCKVILNLNLFQIKLTNDLSSSDLCKLYSSDLRNLVEEWHTFNKKFGELADDYILSIQKIIVLPLKQYKQILDSIKKIIKKSENLQIELNKKKLRIQKLEEKERTANNLVKLDENNLQLKKLNAEFIQQSDSLFFELPTFLHSQIEYMQPILEGFIKSEAFFWGELLQTFAFKNQINFLKFNINKLDLNEYNKIQTESLSKISALSIVEGKI